MCELPMPTILRRMARETDALARMAERLDTAMGGPDGHAAPATVQDIDLLRQSLADLAAFATTLSAHVTADSVAEVGPALDALRLRALRARLAHGASAAQAAPDTDSGTLEVF